MLFELAMIKALEDKEFVPGGAVDLIMVYGSDILWLACLNTLTGLCSGAYQGLVR